MQRTLVLVKPDAVQRGLIGEVVSRLERRGLRFVAMKLMSVNEALAARHYGEHESKPFYEGLVRFITSSPIVAAVVEGENAVELVRATMGGTDPKAADAGTIRGDLAISIGQNLVHGSDSDESAVREIDLFFTPDEIVDYTRDMDRWITEA